HRDGYRAFVLGGRLAAGTAVAWFFAASLVVAAPGLTGFLAGLTRVLIVTGALAVVTGFAVAGMRAAVARIAGLLVGRGQRDVDGNGLRCSHRHPHRCRFIPGRRDGYRHGSAVGNGHA